MNLQTDIAAAARDGDTRERIRALSDAQFHARYACERFTATVLINRLRYAVEHM
ncbi:hypothetical protein QZM92_07135 [Burkholderia multivorans]|nr:hypothetical protein [Burkholderia multivorans]MBU9571111.1 hypothetical protein [Burkholderia multivorans]MDN7961790.1 hypothetical protein [Burkholderia multivorans]